MLSFHRSFCYISIQIIHVGGVFDKFVNTEKNSLKTLPLKNGGGREIEIEK